MFARHAKCLRIDRLSNTLAVCEEPEDMGWGTWYSTFNTRDMSGDYVDMGDRATAARCMDFCAGYQYFGLQWHSFCYCGDEYGSFGEAESEDECDTPCLGDATIMCGGGWRHRYAVDHESALPCDHDLRCRMLSFDSDSVRNHCCRCSLSPSLLKHRLKVERGAASTKSLLLMLSLSIAIETPTEGRVGRSVYEITGTETESRFSDWVAVSGAGPSQQHGLSSEMMALITSDCGAMRSMSNKWP